MNFRLKILKPFISTEIKDRNQVMSKIGSLKLSSHALLFVTNANSMYNNIDMNHAIIVITWWLKDLFEKKNFPQISLLVQS